MIIATVAPTRPLAGDRDVPSNRGISTVIHAAATPEDPAVILQGGPPVRLALPWRNVKWSLTPGPQSISPPPSLSHSVGDCTYLGTDALGLFTVRADIPGMKDPLTWTVRFIGISTTNPTHIDLDNTGTQNYHKNGRITVWANFECKVPIALRGSDDAPACYDRITSGILQNMHWVQGQTLYGIYCTRGSNTIRGHLFEPVPRAMSPNLDCGNEDEFPFYNDTLIETGSQRVHNFDDGPGISIPLLYRPGNDPGDWVDAPDQSFLVLRKVAGSVNFVSAVGARSQHAPHTYVVAGLIHWQLVLNQPIYEIPINDYKKNVRLDLAPFFKPPQQPHGTIHDNIGHPDVIYPKPLEAHSARIETFGPVATKTNKTYQWVPQSGVLI